MAKIVNLKAVKQLIRYGIIGIINNSLGYIVYLALTYSGITPKLAMSLIYGVVAALGFWGNRRLTFEHEGELLISATRYVIAYGVGYIINFIILILLVDMVGYSHRWVQAGAIGVVAIFLFLAQKFYVFKKQA